MAGASRVRPRVQPSQRCGDVRGAAGVRGHPDWDGLVWLSIPACSARAERNLLRSTCMPPTASDLKLAKDLASQIVTAGADRICRIVLVGSRAHGTARPNSDLDLVVLVEPPVGAKPWGTAECRAERDRIARQLSPPGVKVELWVRTTDQYEEARRIECSFEWRVEPEGVEIYRQTIQRRAAATRPVEIVRREHVFAWISHAVRALDAALDAERKEVIGSEAASQFSPLASQFPARAAAIRAVTALLVLHRIHASKQDGLDAMLQRLALPDPHAAARIRSHLTHEALSAPTAHRIVQEVVYELSRDERWRRVLAATWQRLTRPVVVVTPPAPRRAG